MRSKGPHRNGALTAVKSLILARPKSAREKKCGKEMQRISLGLGLSTCGLFFLPALRIAGGVVFVLPIVVDSYKAGYRHLWRERRVSGDVLTAVLATGALAGGYFFALNVGAWFLVLVPWLTLKAEAYSKQGIADLFGQQMRRAWLIVDGAELEVPLERVRVGDLISVRAGQRAPLDGVIVEGYAAIDQKALTGDARPADMGPGDRVFAATLALSGRIAVRVEKAGDAANAAEIARVLTDTSDFRARLTSRAVEFSDSVSLPVLTLGAAALPFVGLGSALALLQASPGYRMDLYGPMSMLSYLHAAARVGILIKDGSALERLRDVDTVVFDKTGTLTLEQPRVRDIHACPGFSGAAVLRYAAIAETGQTHPIARAILEEAWAQGIEADRSDESGYETGYGVTAKVDGALIRVGSAKYMRLQEIVIPPEIHDLEEEVHRRGDSLVLVGVDRAIAGAVVLQPAIRPEVRAIVVQMRLRGLRTYVMSGDRDAPTRHVAHQLKTDGYFAEVLPADKAELVRRLQSEGRKVCFVGDGINDPIALSSADVSVSLHGAATIATDRAQVVFLNGDLVQLGYLFQLARKFEATMGVNFMAATMPGVLIMGGALFFGLGFLPSVLLLQVSVPYAMYNSMRPILAATRRTKSPRYWIEFNNPPAG
jgi:heavy metal translocating P-type ATPase